MPHPFGLPSWSLKTSQKRTLPAWRMWSLRSCQLILKSRLPTKTRGPLPLPPPSPPLPPLPPKSSSRPTPSFVLSFLFMPPWPNFWSASWRFADFCFGLNLSCSPLPPPLPPPLPCLDCWRLRMDSRSWSSVFFLSCLFFFCQVLMSSRVFRFSCARTSSFLLRARLANFLAACDFLRSSTILMRRCSSADRARTLYIIWSVRIISA
mmetsp:Transcript_108076/g.348867  ORF Transcript_108076/g.348867 Transcript_108076/m.348867 type:complete len:207 (-) Transcript_108076:399-1019(-)